MDALIAVLGTLLGGILGAVGTYLNQRSAFRSEAGERLADLRRQVYLEYLIAVHALYGQVDQVHKALHADEIDAGEAARRLRAADARSAQVALENVRLVAGIHAIEKAETLFEWMRREKPPLGQDLSWSAYRGWQHTYWTARQELTHVARKDLGFGRHAPRAADES